MYVSEDIILIYNYNTTNVKNMHLHRDSNPGPCMYTDHETWAVLATKSVSHARSVWLPKPSKL